MVDSVWVVVTVSSVVPIVTVIVLCADVATTVSPNISQFKLPPHSTCNPLSSLCVTVSEFVCIDE